MSAYFVFDITEVTDTEKMQQYRQRVLETVERYDGRYLSVGGRFEMLEGDFDVTFPVLIEFPSWSQARGWYDSDAYKALKALRLSATKGRAMLIDGTTFASESN